MIIKENNPRQAIITSYSRPVMYKDFVLLNGKVVLKFKIEVIDNIKRCSDGDDLDKDSSND